MTRLGGLIAESTIKSDRYTVTLLHRVFEH
jgi:hypothetical protein